MSVSDIKLTLVFSSFYPVFLEKFDAEKTNTYIDNITSTMNFKTNNATNCNRDLVFKRNEITSHKNDKNQIKSRVFSKIVKDVEIKEDTIIYVEFKLDDIDYMTIYTELDKTEDETITDIFYQRIGYIHQPSEKTKFISKNSLSMLSPGKDIGYTIILFVEVLE